MATLIQEVQEAQKVVKKCSLIKLVSRPFFEENPDLNRKFVIFTVAPNMARLL